MDHVITSGNETSQLCIVTFIQFYTILYCALVNQYDYATSMIMTVLGHDMWCKIKTMISCCSGCFSAVITDITLNYMNFVMIGL